MKCLFCFGDGAKIHFDKKHRPYYFCGWCNHRIFIHSPIAYKAIIAWTETAKSLSQQQFQQMIANMEQSEAVRHEKIQAWISQKEIEQNTVVVAND